MIACAPPPSVLQLRSSAGLYGADRMVLALNQALSQREVRSRLLSINNYRMREQFLDDAAHALGQDARLLPCQGRLDLDTVRALVSQIDACSPAVLHAHDYKSAFYAWLAGRRRAVALVATLHGQVDSSRALRLYNRLELALLRRFDALVAVSGAQIDSLLRAGIPRSRLHHIDNGIDLSSATAQAEPLPRASLGLAPSGFVFAAVARLSPEKNLAALLDAFQDVAQASPQVSLLIIGDGPERDALQARSRNLGLDGRVHFTGARDDMHRIYPMIDCLVLPSLSEGMPLVILEAMSFAIPIVASAVGDVPRLLSHADCGRLVPAGDTGALRAALLAAADLPGRRDQRAREHALRHHSAAAMAERYIAIYQPFMADAYVRKAS